MLASHAAQSPRLIDPTKKRLEHRQIESSNPLPETFQQLIESELTMTFITNSKALALAASFAVAIATIGLGLTYGQAEKSDESKSIELATADDSQTDDPFGDQATVIDQRENKDHGRSNLISDEPVFTASQKLQNLLHQQIIQKLESQDEIEYVIATEKFKPDFSGIPLRHAIAQISDKMGIPMIFDVVAMESGISTPDDPVNLTTKELTYNDVMSLVLEPLDLAYVVKDEYILITTIDSGTEKVIKTYNLEDFSKKIASSSGIEKLQTMIKTFVPGEWDLGEDLVEIFDGRLVVSCSSKTHAEIQRFLVQLTRR